MGQLCQARRYYWRRCQGHQEPQASITAEISPPVTAEDRGQEADRHNERYDGYRQET